MVRTEYNGMRWVAIALSVALAGPAMAQAPTLGQATDTLRISLEEWRREDAAYRSARGSAKISPRESEEYAGYVAGLRLRVLEQCEVVRGIGGESAIQDFDCVRTGGAGRAAAVVPPATVLTEEEKRAAMLARLDALEGDIDDSLQKRQQEIRQTNTGSGRGTGAGGGAAGSGSGSGSGNSARQQGGREGGQGTTWSNPDAAKTSEEGGATAAGASGSTAPTAGTPSASGGTTAGDRQGVGGRQASRDGASDDDVVARQLREAAEKETDPVLKEKLWEEYRKYKEGRR